MSTIDYKLLTKTRAEEHDADVWGTFYIPPYFERLNLTNATKPTYFIGKRGCGKTMLLKYLSYQSKFSLKRDFIPQQEIEHVGIYWRIDTHFSSSMYKRNKSIEEWINIFEKYFAIIISSEICKSLYHISKSNYNFFNHDDLKNIKLNELADFGLDIPTNLLELETYLKVKHRSFSSWISNIEVVEPQAYPPGLNFLQVFIESLKSNEKLSNINFYIYIDEIENLLSYQRRFMNTVLKHSQKPLIVNFTSKVFFDENMTIGNESINATHDYNYKDLDELMKDNERRAFFSEVFINNFNLAFNKDTKIDINLVTDETRLSERADVDYQNNMIQLIKEKFPSITIKEHAENAYKTERISNKIDQKISKQLEKSSINLSDFKFAGFLPEALIIIPFLLERKSNTPESILEQYIAYHNKQPSKFNDWVHNNLFGALLELYRPFNDNKCPLFSGFEAFYTMANGNLRHFLILCYKTLEINEMFDLDNNQFNIEIQAQSAFEASNALIKEIRTLGKYGEKLRIFTLRLGNIFRVLQENPLLSEPEQNQFTINSGNRLLNEDELIFIEEAKKHSILIESSETKTKSKIGLDIVDYLLNPIYAPYFNISYRRKRKIELSVEDFHYLINGTETEYKGLLTQLVRPKRVILNSDQQNTIQLGFFE
ncbi:hypothetical protein ACULUM_001008 [Acinetobacter baumannii]|uniref:ORC-CDC6 family AAA ATPase n=1 Tax=Acinetobacter TaxID=469 RepID=UPI001BC895E9|nr:MULTISPECIES: hypothetical protein [Acinetobacter calcoaceticus/baumannii complex]MCH2072916.1 hypothetical protein [Acinetobacter pittii]